jgi:hypothetical protein
VNRWIEAGFNTSLLFLVTNLTLKSPFMIERGREAHNDRNRGKG